MFLAEHGQRELQERRKVLEEGEKALESRIQEASRRQGMEKQAAMAEVEEGRKAVSRDREDLASRLEGLREREQRRARETAVEAQAAALKVPSDTLRGMTLDHLLAIVYLIRERVRVAVYLEAQVVRNSRHVGDVNGRVHVESPSHESQ